MIDLCRGAGRLHLRWTWLFCFSITATDAYFLTKGYEARRLDWLQMERHDRIVSSCLSAIPQTDMRIRCGDNNHVELFHFTFHFVCLLCDGLHHEVTKFEAGSTS
jgi:hypothetical protein